METSNEFWDDTLKILRDIGLAYAEFLKQGRLQSTNLTRMTYLHAMKKEYVANPLDNREIQTAVTSHLDMWLGETYIKMVNEMTPSQRPRLRVATMR